MHPIPRNGCIRRGLLVTDHRNWPAWSRFVPSGQESGFKLVLFKILRKKKSLAARSKSRQFPLVFTGRALDGCETASHTTHAYLPSIPGRYLVGQVSCCTPVQVSRSSLPTSQARDPPRGTRRNGLPAARQRDRAPHRARRRCPYRRAPAAAHPSPAQQSCPRSDYPRRRHHRDHRRRGAVQLVSTRDISAFFLCVEDTEARTQWLTDANQNQSVACCLPNRSIKSIDPHLFFCSVPTTIVHRSLSRTPLAPRKKYIASTFTKTSSSRAFSSAGFLASHSSPFSVLSTSSVTHSLIRTFNLVPPLKTKPNKKTCIVRQRRPIDASPHHHLHERPVRPTRRVAYDTDITSVRHCAFSSVPVTDSGASFRPSSASTCRLSWPSSCCNRLDPYVLCPDLPS
jgi:hypothetical protein